MSSGTFVLLRGLNTAKQDDSCRVRTHLFRLPVVVVQGASHGGVAVVHDTRATFRLLGTDSGSDGLTASATTSATPDGSTWLREAVSYAHCPASGASQADRGAARAHQVSRSHEMVGVRPRPSTLGHGQIAIIDKRLDA